MALTMEDFEYFKSFGNSVPFMDGREKGNLADILGEIVHIEEYAFLSNDEGDYAVMAFSEYPALFFFGNAIVTEMLHKVEDDGKAASLPEVGIQFKLRRSAKGRTYTSFEFVF